MPVILRVFFLAALALLAAAAPAQNLPSPDEFAGFPIGSDGNLLRWEKIVAYFELLAEQSDRVALETLGKTNNGAPFILAVISSPENLARVDEIRERQRRIAHPKGLSEPEIEELAWSSPAVVLVTCNIHATEIASSQMAVELAHRMASEDSRRMLKVLENVVFLLVPSFNPDGQAMVVDWNNRVRGTKNRWAPLPWLYHPYAGHDNNRDAFMMTQPESRYVNRILFQDWFPQVYLDEHQQGFYEMRVFVPPFANPINPNVDPVIWAQAGRLGFSMYQALHEAGFRGVAYAERYTGWWQGGFLRGAWFHNMVGMLTEVASANLAGPVHQKKAKLGERAPNPPTKKQWLDEREKNPDAPAPPPTDTMPRYNYPRPWLGGKWTLRNIIDAELALTTALLESAADSRTRLIEAQIRMGLRAIAAGEKGDPWAYAFPPDQHDPGALYRLLEVLHYSGVEVRRASEEFAAEGRSFPAGTYLIPMAQPFRAYAKDLLEPQSHPDPKEMPVGSMSEQPYDLTAWTLPLQMGVETVRLDKPVEAKSEKLKRIPAPQGEFLSGRGKPRGFLIRPEPNAAAIAVNRLLADGAQVSLLSEEFESDGTLYPAGTVWARGVDRERIASLAEELGLKAAGASRGPAKQKLRRVQKVRTALYRPWTASMDEGWTRWLLEQYEFPFSTVLNAELRAGKLGRSWDAIILPGDRGDKQIVEGNDRKSTPKQYRGGIGEKGRKALREFVSRGGTLITMGDSTEFALRTFALPLRNALEHTSRKEFYGPGVFLSVLFDPETPLAYGMPEQGTAVFKNDAAFAPVPGFAYTDFAVVARYPGADLLDSGWIRGPEHLHNRIAAAEVRYKKGRIVLIGFRPQFRAQPQGTFKLLFNAIRLAGSSPPE